MPTVQQSVVAIPFAAADPAAAPTVANLTPAGMPDTADVAGLIMPFTGTIVGIALTGNPASGDTVTAAPVIGSTKSGAGIQANSLIATITNAAPAAYTIVTKDQADAQFTAGQFVAVNYLTTTGSSYTTRDIHVTLYISTGRTDI